MALVLDALATDDQVLVHGSVAAELDDSWLLEPATALVDLRLPIDAMLLTGRRAAEDEATASVEM